MFALKREIFVYFNILIIQILIIFYIINLNKLTKYTYCNCETLKKNWFIEFTPFFKVSACIDFFLAIFKANVVD